MGTASPARQLVRLRSGEVLPGPLTLLFQARLRLAKKSSPLPQGERVQTTTALLARERAQTAIALLGARAGWPGRARP